MPRKLRRREGKAGSFPTPHCYRDERSRMTARAKRFPLMDSLRAIAALSIVVYHAGYFGGLQGVDFVVHKYTAGLDGGGTIFFMVSGVLLYRPFVRARLA